MLNMISVSVGAAAGFQREQQCPSAGESFMGLAVFEILVSQIEVQESCPPHLVETLCKPYSAAQVYRIRWTVDARKLRSTDKEAVSPPFEAWFCQCSSYRSVETFCVSYIVAEKNMEATVL